MTELACKLPTDVIEALGNVYHADDAGRNAGKSEEMLVPVSESVKV